MIVPRGRPIIAARYQRFLRVTKCPLGQALACECKRVEKPCSLSCANLARCRRLYPQQGHRSATVDGDDLMSEPGERPIMSVTIRRAERKIAAVRPRLVHSAGNGWAGQQAGAVCPEIGASERNFMGPIGIEK